MAPSQRRSAFQTTRRDNNQAYPARNPANDDFFTDSVLDSSRIPTPSPSKHHAQNISPSKPRRAIGNTRTLRAAWDATAGFSRPSSSASNAPSMQENFKPLPVQARRKSPANAKKWKSTPSPPRGERTPLPLASPTSDASSPPGGLNDVYQRIADEEKLAAQEGEIEEEDFTDSTMSYEEHVESDRARLNRIRTSQSPLNFRPSSRNTPPHSADANKENQADEVGLTDVSGMSFLENMTDQVLAAKLTPHTQDRARDRARLDKAIQKTTPLAFSKAQVGSKHALTAENLQRSGRRENQASLHSSSNDSLRNENATPPPNVPRNWGTKGRVDKDWLRKIHDRNGNSASGSIKGSPNGDKHLSSQLDWTAAAAEVPLPSVEDSLTPRPEHSSKSTPASLSKQSSLDRIRQWELNEFTGTNLQVSESPPVKVRNNMPDHFRDREIETLEKRAVTTNRLGEIMKKNSTEFSTGKSRPPSMGQRNVVEDQPLPAKHEEITKIEEEGECIPDTPIVVFKASTNGIKIGDVKNRPLHDRRDSRDSLQRLARAMSESPRPSSTPEDWSLIKEDEIEAMAPVIRPSEIAPAESRKSSKEVADIHHTSSMKRSRSADAARTPVVTGAWTDTILPDTIKTVKQRQVPSKYAQTPHVTGGWIDTPMIHGRRQSSALAPMSIEELSPPNAGHSTKETIASVEETSGGEAVTKSTSNLPRSALTSLLSKAKQKLAAKDQQQSAIHREDLTIDMNNDTLNLGDATIESLEDLLTLDNADMTTLLRMGVEYEARENPSGKDHRDREGHLDTETELLERLGTKLERLRTNIHDARKGISKLEHQVSQPPSHSSQTSTQLLQQPGKGCRTCGCRGALLLPGSNSDIYLTLTQLHIPIPRLWHYPRSRQTAKANQTHSISSWTSRLPHPTRLGYLTLLLWLWYLSETLLCYRYCKPEYAEYYVWDDFDRTDRFAGWGKLRSEELVFGRVAWLLLFDKARALLGRPGAAMGGFGWGIWVLLHALVRWVGIMSGWTDGFVGNVVGQGAGLAASTTAAGSAATELDTPVLSMGQDEFL